MKTALLDVNVLIALNWPAHEHHQAAHRWYATQPRRWASCPLTQLAFVRLLSNPAVTRDALSTAHARSLLDKVLAHGRHEFWPDDIPVPAALDPVAAGLEGHRQIADAYLLAVAGRRQGTLATFDRGVKVLAGRTLESIVEVISAR